MKSFTLASIDGHTESVLALCNQKMPEVIRMSIDNLHAFLEYSGGVFCLSGSIARQFEMAEKYPSWKEEGGHNFVGMARMIARYDVRPDHRKAIRVL